ncbi:MAG: response regulator transcription factor [Flavobacteriales bacterium]|nr:response regulator transcription factor [Flavobacteriales bacterium]
MINLLLVDDHQVLLDGLKSLLDATEGLHVSGMAHNGKEAIEALALQPVDVVLLDIHMPVMDGLEACPALLAVRPGVKVIAMSMYGEGQLVQAMLTKGASGYLLKSCAGDELVQAIRTVHAGGTWLSRDASASLVENIRKPEQRRMVAVDPPTGRELAVLKLIARERTTEEIARELGITVNTVESHRRQLLQKLGARNSAGLVRIAMEQGLL